MDTEIEWAESISGNKVITRTLTNMRFAEKIIKISKQNIKSLRL